MLPNLSSGKRSEKLTRYSIALRCRSALAVRAVSSTFDSLDSRASCLSAQGVQLSRLGARVSRAVNEECWYLKLGERAVIKILRLVSRIVGYP